MDQFLKMDIFFFVTTVVVLAAGVLLCFALYYLVRILRNVEKVSEEIEEETRAVREDIRDARANIRNEGFKLKHLTALARKAGERLFKAKK
ncbi:MAG: hypothetical protein WDN10_05200 [bacterium]